MVLVDAGALQLAINVLERAGKMEVVEELRKATTPDYGKVQFGVGIPIRDSDMYWSIPFTKLKDVDIESTYALIMQIAGDSPSQCRIDRMFAILAKLEQSGVIKLDVPDVFVMQNYGHKIDVTTVRNYDNAYGDNLLVDYIEFKAKQKSPEDDANALRDRYLNVWSTPKSGE